MIQVFLVDDHPIVRHGFAQLLATEPDIALCGQAADARAALDSLSTLVPDVVIVDVSLGSTSGIDLIHDIKARLPRAAVLVVSMRLGRCKMMSGSVMSGSITSRGSIASRGGSCGNGVYPQAESPTTHTGKHSNRTDFAIGTEYRRWGAALPLAAHRNASALTACALGVFFALARKGMNTLVMGAAVRSGQPALASVPVRPQDHAGGITSDYVYQGGGLIESGEAAEFARRDARRQPARRRSPSGA